MRFLATFKQTAKKAGVCVSLCLFEVDDLWSYVPLWWVMHVVCLFARLSPKTQKKEKKSTVNELGWECKINW